MKSHSLNAAMRFANECVIACARRHDATGSLKWLNAYVRMQYARDAILDAMSDELGLGKKEGANDGAPDDDGG